MPYTLDAHGNLAPTEMKGARKLMKANEIITLILIERWWGEGGGRGLDGGRCNSTGTCLTLFPFVAR